MAVKSYEKDPTQNLSKPQGQPCGKKSPQRRQREDKGSRSQALLRIMFLPLPQRAPEVGLRKRGKQPLTTAIAPVALFYNLANGFLNLPSYDIRNDANQQRDEVKGFGSGCKLAGKVSSPLGRNVNHADVFSRSLSSVLWMRFLALSSTLISVRNKKASLGLGRALAEVSVAFTSTQWQVRHIFVYTSNWPTSMNSDLWPVGVLLEGC